MRSIGIIQKILPTRLKKEKLEVKKNGGKTIYSNEITFSSSNLINNYFENFSKELRNKIQLLKSKNIIQKIHKNIKKIQNKNSVNWRNYS